MWKYNILRYQQTITKIYFTSLSSEARGTKDQDIAVYGFMEKISKRQKLRLHSSISYLGGIHAHIYGF